MVSVSINESGLDEIKATLDLLGGNVEAALSSYIGSFALTMKAAAIDGIKSPPASGRIYTRYYPYRKHQASAPGEYPNEDMGELAQSIRAEINPLEATVGSSLVYAYYLQFGTTKMEPRPWLTLAYAEAESIMRHELKNQVFDAIQAAIRGHRKRSHLRAAFSKL